MRLRIPVVHVALLAAVGCASDSVSGVRSLQPAIDLDGSIGIEPRLAARVFLPISPGGSGQVFLRLQITNGLADVVTSGACADRVDVKPVDGATWFNATPAQQICTDQLVSFMPGAPSKISAAVNPRTMRSVAGGAGRPVLVRVSHLVWRNPIGYGVQSAEQVVTAP